MEQPTAEELTTVQKNIKAALISQASECDKMADAGDAACKAYEELGIRGLKKAQLVPPGVNAKQWKVIQQSYAEGALAYTEGLTAFNNSLRTGAANARTLAEML